MEKRRILMHEKVIVRCAWIKQPGEEGMCLRDVEFLGSDGKIHPAFSGLSQTSAENVSNALKKCAEEINKGEE